MCRVDLDETVNCLSDTNQIARKTHRCCECRRDIQPGEQYNKQFTVFDGYTETYKTCSHCQVARRWLMKNCSGWIYQDVIDEVLEHAREYRRTDLARIAVGARHKWKLLRADGLMPVPALPAELTA